MNNQSKKAIDTLLSESFKELSTKKPIEKITIKEITDKAGVIRPTFYNHFQDKYELLQWIVSVELVDPLREYVKKGQVKEGVMGVLETIDKDRSFYVAASRLEGQNSFSESLRELMYELCLEFLDVSKLQRYSGYAWLTTDRVAILYGEVMSFMVIEWITSTLNVSKHEVADAIINVLKYAPAEFFQVKDKGGEGQR
ncbi:MAG: TetR/AcrR family transcriptional regulator C-terminal domain-containing protein [Lachnospiraceae bacterium]|nr:TetR/AcrR family transcriptional regulator C-terminal domain-containing protein [Lachnospiraceae bacterium]